MVGGRCRCAMRYDVVSGIGVLFGMRCCFLLMSAVCWTRQFLAGNVAGGGREIESGYGGREDMVESILFSRHFPFNIHSPSTFHLTTFPKLFHLNSTHIIINSFLFLSPCQDTATFATSTRTTTTMTTMEVTTMMMMKSMTRTRTILNNSERRSVGRKRRRRRR